MAAERVALSFLTDHPDLRPFLLSSARATGTTIGSGSYGSVEEVDILGAVCAAKKIHHFFQDPREMPPEGIEKAATEFVRECRLMSTLRHPHIVQFLGVCFLPGSLMPALVMEKLATSLHDILDPPPAPATKPFIPASLKRSVLHDVARGLSFLHSHSTPIIHRDLSARNVLLNEGMVAKIADLGNARIVPSLRAYTMTKAPGASIYMPPEALEDESRYDVTIDIFSLGVLAIFTISQIFPKPVAAAYMDDSGRMVGRTELERRDNYMLEVMKQFREGHPLVQMIHQCLKNRMRERPTIQQVMVWLEKARADVEDGEYDVNKLLLAQLLQSRNLHIEQQQLEIHSLKEQNEVLKEQNEGQKVQSKSVEEQIPPENPAITPAASDTQPPTKNTSLSPVQLLQRPLSLNWRKGKDIPTKDLFWASSVVINGMVYCGGNDLSSNTVIQYNPESGDWSKILRSPVVGFAVTSLDGQLVLAGGGDYDTRITVWDSGCNKWVYPYPVMPTGRATPAAVGYQKYLIVACGFPYRSDVEVLDSSSGRWYRAQPVPVGGYWMSSAVVGDRWYLSSFGGWKDGKEHIFWAHLPTLTSSITSAHTEHIWQELPTPPVAEPTLLALQGHLLLVGGKGHVQEIHCYDQETGEWRVCGQLPVGMQVPCSAVLPSGDLMVAGGGTGDTENNSKRMWIAKI